jgi:hypothetical protein
MSDQNRESLLWKKVKAGLTKCFLTRVESSTINGIPDIHGVSSNKVFWIELKSDKLSYPALNKWQVVWINKYIKAGGVVFIFKETLSLRSLKLYRPVSVFTDPRELKPRFEFSFPVNWAQVQEHLLRDTAPEQLVRSRSRSRLKLRSRSLKAEPMDPAPDQTGRQRKAG